MTISLHSYSKQVTNKIEDYLQEQVKDFNTMKREEIYSEVILKKIVREGLIRDYIRPLAEQLAQKRIESRFNFAVALMKEAKKSPIPLGSTGANVLEDAIKKIIPIIRDDFFSLTTSVQQRRSYRAHVLKAFENALRPLREKDKINTDPSQDKKDIGNILSGEDGNMVVSPPAMNEADEVTGNSPLPDEEDQNDNGIPDIEEKFIEVDPEKQKADETADTDKKEVDDFQIEGEDATGRNMAIVSFKKVEKTIVDNYSLLDSNKDREEYYDYGLANMAMYFDRWEDELALHMGA